MPPSLADLTAPPESTSPKRRARVAPVSASMTTRFSVLRVADKSSPPLSRYRRVIVTVEP